MEKVVHYADNSTVWEMIAEDGTGYTTLALMQAAGKLPYPAIAQFGQTLEHLTLRSINNANADGSQFYYALPSDSSAFEGLVSDAARDAVANFCSGSGQTRTEPGFNGVSKRPISCVWCRKTVGTDSVILEGIL